MIASGTWCQCMSHKVSIHWAVSLAALFSGKKPSEDELSSNISSSCDNGLLQLAVEGEGSFSSIVQRYRGGSWKKETTEEYEDNDDAIRFATLQSRFENKEQSVIGKL